MHMSRVLVVPGLLGVVLAASSATFAQTAPIPSRPALSTRDQIASYVSEASQRFGIPDAWITAVMRVESGGDPTATSSAGAIGLMQVMPDTYTTLRARLGLRANIFDPHDNIMAGAAYLRELHDRYGAVGFLAAYNAGPGRWEDHLAGVRPLPPETIRYMARLAPMIGNSDTGMFARAIWPKVMTIEAAPIFVAMSTRSPATSPHQVGSTNVQLAAIRALDDERTGALFTVRQAAAGPQMDAVATVSNSTAFPFRPGAPSGEPAPPVMSSDPLFVRRIPAQRQPR